MLDNPLSNEQGPAGPGLGGLPTPGVPGSDTLRLASHVSSPSVSRTNSSTFVALMGRPFSTSVAVCRHLCRGDAASSWCRQCEQCGSVVEHRWPHGATNQCTRLCIACKTNQVYNCFGFILQVMLPA